MVEYSEAPNAIRLEVNESILFSIGSAELKTRGKTLLQELANIFKQQPGNIYVEGHTDNVPISTAQYPSNWELSSTRATTVARHLINQGVRPEHLRTIGFADTKPRAGNDTADGRSRNRRVSLVVALADSNTSAR